MVAIRKTTFKNRIQKTAEIERKNQRQKMKEERDRKQKR